MNNIAQALFNPRSIALIGASDNAQKNTARPQRYLRQHGYPGQIAPINPNRKTVLGEPAYANLLAVPYPIDHAYIMVPTAKVMAAVTDCAAANIPVVTIYSDGFADAGVQGKQRQDELLSIARRHNIRLLGPNSIGVINPQQGLTLSVSAVLETPSLNPGSLALVSQSGSILGTLLSRAQARGHGFSRLVSVGNEADLSVAEIVTMLADDEHTKTILLFLETIRDGPQLGAAVRLAQQVGKPVIVYKLGRSSAGAELALSHTGAIAGDDAVCEAFFRHHGIYRVAMLETLFELPALLQTKKTIQGKRVAVLTTNGGGAAMVVDRLGDSGIELIPAPAQLRQQLNDFGIRVSDSPIIDLTLAGARREIYSTALNSLLNSDHCDAVLAVVGSSGQFHPEVAVEPIASAANPGKPLAVFISPQADDSLRLLNQAGIAAFRTPEACADALRACLDWTPPVQEQKPIRQQISNMAADLMDEWQARDFFANLGIAQTPAQILTHAEQAVTIPFPLAAKILSPDIIHKSDAGGVVLNINSPEELQAAYRQIIQNVTQRQPKAKIRGVLIQTMATGLIEILIGFRRTELGPVITVAPGGLLAEIYNDAAIRIAPIDLGAAHAMLAEVKGLALLRGYRNHAKGDLDALAQALVSLSQLAHYDNIIEAEINPLLVKQRGQGVVAVDALIR